MGWNVWNLDHITWGWIGWIAFFILWESYSLWLRTGQELTEHLRPVFLTHSLLWFIAVGVWWWIGVHLLAPRLESWILSAVRFSAI